MRLVLLAGVLCVFVLASPSSAHGAVPRGFVGVMGDGPLFTPAVSLDREVDLMARAGVESLRVAFYWARAQPLPPGAAAPPGWTDVGGVPTNFAETDRVVAAATRRRIEVLPVVLLTPRWARQVPPELWSPPAPATYAHYTRYVAALVARYKPGGSFWRARPDLRPLPIRAWQVWNEPNGPRFWTVQPGLAQYATLLRMTRVAVKRADARARVVLAGLTASSWTSLAKLYRLGAVRSADMVALNPFSAEPRSVVRIVKRARKVMTRNGDGLKPLLVTETSWPSAKNRVADPFGYEETEAGQARRLQEVLRALARERVRLRIRQVFWYTWMSFDRDPGYSFDWAGVRRLEGTRVATKPAYHALRRVARALEGCAARPVPRRCKR
jgi:hypothetical protein